MCCSKRRRLRRSRNTRQSVANTRTATPPVRKPIRKLIPTIALGHSCPELPLRAVTGEHLGYLAVSTLLRHGQRPRPSTQELPAPQPDIHVGASLD